MSKGKEPLRLSEMRGRQKYEGGKARTDWKIAAGP